jgi:transcription termination factor Rho
MRIEIKATAPRGAGKTYILNRLAEEVRRIQAELPGRKISLVLVEEHPVDPHRTVREVMEQLGKGNQ